MKIVIRKTTILLSLWGMMVGITGDAEAKVKDLSQLTSPAAYVSEWDEADKLLYLESENGVLSFEISWYAPDINQFSEIFDKPVFLKTWVENYCQSAGLVVERYEKTKVSGKIALDIYARPQDEEGGSTRHRILFFAFREEVYYISGVLYVEPAASPSYPDDVVYQHFLKQF